MQEVNYSLYDRLLHHLALGFPTVGKISLELDQALMSNEKIHMDERPVFISGLARAGTTILMRTFYGTGLFRSLTYRDLPFVLMPGIWKKISRISSKDKSAKERAHGDGIMVSFDSPEAFEEIFWRTFCSEDYIFSDHLKPHHVNEEVIDLFKGFVKQVVISRDQPSQQRYLSKNNNNILRLNLLRQAFPDAIIIIPFRDPVQQSISLFNLHKKFCDMQSKDSFCRQYMEWLGHFEFGATHKAFRFENKLSQLDFDHAPDNINYWLTIWINTYSYILKSAPPDSLFVSFEQLCSSPKVTLENLFSQAGLSRKEGLISEKIEAPKDRAVENIDMKLLEKARETYHILSTRAKKDMANPHS